jgi:hypothetical protein
VTFPSCCAIQCLPCNLATHCAVGAEHARGRVGRQGAARQRSIAVAQSRSSRFLRFDFSRMGRIRHNILLRFRGVTVDGVWIDEWLY